jgi:SAM-dependent methyltransferase
MRVQPDHNRLSLVAGPSPLASGRLKIVLDDGLHFLTNQPSHAFDIIASGYVLHNLIGDYRARLYDEIWRVLAPSGLFVNADKYAQTVEAHREALRWQLNSFFDVFVTRQRYDLLREWVLHYVEDEAAGRVMPEADAIRRLNDLGFADVRIACRRYMDAVSPDTRRVAVWGFPPLKRTRARDLSGTTAMLSSFSVFSVL